MDLALLVVLQAAVQQVLTIITTVIMILTVVVPILVVVDVGVTKSYV